MQIWRQWMGRLTFVVVSICMFGCIEPKEDGPISLFSSVESIQVEPLFPIISKRIYWSGFTYNEGAFFYSLDSDIHKYDPMEEVGEITYSIPNQYTSPISPDYSGSFWFCGDNTLSGSLHRKFSTSSETVTDSINFDMIRAFKTAWDPSLNRLIGIPLGGGTRIYVYDPTTNTTEVGVYPFAYESGTYTSLSIMNMLSDPDGRIYLTIEFENTDSTRYDIYVCKNAASFDVEKIYTIEGEFTPESRLSWHDGRIFAVPNLSGAQYFYELVFPDVNMAEGDDTSSVEMAECGPGYRPCSYDSSSCCEVICPPGYELGGPDWSDCVAVECDSLYHWCERIPSGCCPDTVLYGNFQVGRKWQYEVKEYYSGEFGSSRGKSGIEVWEVESISTDSSLVHFSSSWNGIYWSRYDGGWGGQDSYSEDSVFNYFEADLYLVTGEFIGEYPYNFTALSNLSRNSLATVLVPYDGFTRNVYKSGSSGSKDYRLEYTLDMDAGIDWLKHSYGDSYIATSGDWSMELIEVTP